MSRIVIELTNRCNLRCQHCPDGRHGGKGEMSLDIIAAILSSAQSEGFTEFAFTGGEPTLHRNFTDILKDTADAGYTFGFVTNGWSFAKHYDALLPLRDALTGLTFSMDGASAETHDHIRGKDSFRRLMQAFSICVLKGIPFAINMVITRANQHEIENITTLAAALGSRGLRFGHFIETGRPSSDTLALDYKERRNAEAHIWELQNSAAIPIAMAPGYHTTELFPCASLHSEEFNIDWQGNVSPCCHLSGFGTNWGSEEVVANLNHQGLAEALAQLRCNNESFRRNKLKRFSASNIGEENYSPCGDCLKQYGKPPAHALIPLAQLAKATRSAAISINKGIETCWP